jgi:hypothetical protein
MKRSSKVTLTVVAAMGLTACSRRYDPCESRYFDATACADAVRGGGYYWHGSWYPMTYSYPYPYYYDSYRRHVSSGGSVVTPPAGSYARPGVSGPGKSFGTGGSTPSSGSTMRGGFGSTGAGHSAGG